MLPQLCGLPRLMCIVFSACRIFSKIILADNPISCERFFHGVSEICVIRIFSNIVEISSIPAAHCRFFHCFDSSNILDHTLGQKFSGLNNVARIFVNFPLKSFLFNVRNWVKPELVA